MKNPYAEENTDAMAEVKETARKHVIEEQAAKNFSNTRSKLVLGRDASHAFFATLAFKLEPVATYEIETLATDGKKLFYNPEYFIFPMDESKALLSAACMKLALAHHARSGTRNEQKWQIASKLAVHPLVAEAGFKLPKEALFPGKKPDASLKLPPGLIKAIEKMAPGEAAEAYYDLIPDDPAGPGQGGGGSGEGQGGQGEPQKDVDGCGTMKTPGDGSAAAKQQAEAEAKINAAEAKNVAKQRGTLPGGLEKAIEALMEPKVDWRDVLREFVSSHARCDYSWAPPNRRFVHAGVYLPGLRSEVLGDIVLVDDTSGSVWEVQDVFASEMQGILEAYNCSVTIVYCDAAVQRVQEWSSGDGDLKLYPVGGGGTSHVPVWEWLKTFDKEPACVVCLTDCLTAYGSDPGVPVLWCCYDNKHAAPPFGRLVHIEKENR